MNPIVTVIIPTYKDWQRLQLCVNALAKQSLSRTDFEIIIVNNDPSGLQPTDFVLPDGFLLVQESIPGSYAARNAAIKMSKGELLAFTDSDCIPDKDWLKNACKLFQDPQIGLIGGKVNIFREGKGSYFMYRYEKFASFQQYITIPQGRGVTANLFVRKNIVEQIGGFDQNLKSGGDWVFTRKCVDNGYRFIYDDKVVVNHPARKNLMEFLKKEKRLVAWGFLSSRNKIHFILKQLYVGLYRLVIAHSRLKVPFTDRIILLYIDSVRVSYRFYVGLLVLFKIIDTKEIRS